MSDATRPAPIGPGDPDAEQGHTTTPAEIADRLLQTLGNTVGGNQIADSVRSAGSFEEAVRILIEDFRYGPDELIRFAGVSIEDLPDAERAEREAEMESATLERTEAVTRQELQAQATQRMLAEAVARAEADPKLFYNETEDQFYLRSDPLTETGQQIDWDLFVTAGTINVVVDPDTGRTVEKSISAEDWLGIDPLEELERTEDFIGGIPADFESQRRVFDRDVFNEQVDTLVAQGLSHTRAEQILNIAGIGIRRATPVHEAGDELFLAGAPPEQVAQWQNLMVEAGYLRRRDLVGQTGLYVSSTMQGPMIQVLKDADLNGYGDNPTEWLNRVAQARSELTPQELALEAGLRPFAAPAYIAPDYATLSQSVRGLFRQIVGRDARDDELALLAQRMDRDFRRKHRVEVSAARATHDAGNRAVLEGTPQSAGSVGRGVSPIDRLGENILSRFETEIDRNQVVADTQRNTIHLMNVLAGLEQAVI